MTVVDGVILIMLSAILAVLVAILFMAVLLRQSRVDKEKEEADGINGLMLKIPVPPEIVEQMRSGGMRRRRHNHDEAVVPSDRDEIVL